MASYIDSPEEGRGRRDLAVAVFFLFFAFAMMYMPTGLQGLVAGAMRDTVLRPFIAVQTGVARARVRSQEALRLQAQLDSLAAMLVSEGSMAEENARLRELLGLKGKAPSSLVPANAIRAGLAGSEGMFLLDVGAESGVRAGDPVLVVNGILGLAGVIREARKGSSLGIDWSHPDFRASAMSADGRVFGFVEPVRGERRELDRLLLDGVAYYERLEPGTVIATSGLGGFYPRGIPIGVVLGLQEREGEWRQAFWLRPVVETGDVTHVLVVTGRTPGEELRDFLEDSLPAISDSAVAGALGSDPVASGTTVRSDPEGASGGEESSG